MACWAIRWPRTARGGFLCFFYFELKLEKKKQKKRATPHFFLEAGGRRGGLPTRLDGRVDLGFKVASRSFRNRLTPSPESIGAGRVLRAVVKKVGYRLGLRGTPPAPPPKG